MVEATQTKIRRVAVLGASGRMGSEAVKAITDAPDLELVAALGREDSLEKLVETNAEIMVDLTVPTATETNVRRSHSTSSCGCARGSWAWNQPGRYRE